MILTRQQEQRDRHLTVEEAKLQHICSAVHGAAGNRKGARQAQKIRLRPKRPQIPSYEQMTRLFGEGDADG